MKILHTVESYLPSRHGMSEVVRQLSEGLVKLGHEVIVLTSFNSERELIAELNGVKIISFNISGNSLIGISGDKEGFVNYILNEKYDVLTNFAAQQWATDLCLPILDKIKVKLFFVPTGFSALNNPLYRQYFEKMPYWMSRYDSNIFLSKNYQDYKFALEKKVLNIRVIPNGASFSEFHDQKFNFNIKRYLNISENSKIIMHIGSYTGIKGHNEAIEIFIKSKSKNTHLVFVGQNFKDSSGRFFRMHINWFKEIWSFEAIKFRTFKILFKYLQLFLSNKKSRIHGIGLTRKELICALKQSDIFLFPSLIECSPVVIFEAMASSIPIIASPVGNISEIIEKSHSGKIIRPKKTFNDLTYPDINHAAGLIDQLILDQNLRLKMGKSGYSYWKNNFTWEKIVLKYESLYLGK
jgi:glycosyltransferase involved in cell wall biosynthesis